MPSNKIDNGKKVAKTGNEFYFKNIVQPVTDSTFISTTVSNPHDIKGDVPSTTLNTNALSVNEKLTIQTTESTAQNQSLEWEQEVVRKNPNIYDSNELNELSAENATAKNEFERIKNEKMDLIEPITTTYPTVKADFETNDEDYSYEDYAVEYNGRKLTRKNKIRIHTSYQVSSWQKPLAQGFLASTGYPMYYVGENECVWKVSAGDGQRVRLTVLDINLRCKFVCNVFFFVVVLKLN